MYLVQKAFNEGDLRREPGEIVTGEGYRWLNRLVTLRYLKAVKLKKSVDTFKCQLCETERCFIDEESLGAHYLTNHRDQVEVVEDPESDDKKSNDEEETNSDDDKKSNENVEDQNSNDEQSNEDGDENSNDEDQK